MVTIDNISVTKKSTNEATGSLINFHSDLKFIIYVSFCVLYVSVLIFRDERSMFFLEISFEVATFGGLLHARDCYFCDLLTTVKFYHYFHGVGG